MKFFLTVLLSASIFSCANAGEFLLYDTSPDPEDTLTFRQLLFSVDYLSVKTYLGNQTTVSQKYIAPALSYHAPSGFYSEFTAAKIIYPETLFDAADLTIGWDFRILKSLQTSLSYSRFIFSKNSQQPSSMLRNNFEVIFKKELHWLTPLLYLDLFFGQANPDFAARFEITHDFEIDYLFTKDNDALIISPTASIAAATLNSYSLYLLNTTLPRSRQNLGVNVDSNFKLASIDLSLLVEYDFGKFLLRPEVRQTIPLIHVKNLDNQAITYFVFTLGFFII